MLFSSKRLRKFKKIWQELNERAVQETFKEPSQQIVPLTEGGEQQTATQLWKVDIMTELVTRELNTVTEPNHAQLYAQFDKLRSAYLSALDSNTPSNDYEMGFIDP